MACLRSASAPCSPPTTDNSLDAAHAWSGLGLGGTVEVPVNTAYKGRFLSHVLNDSGAGFCRRFGLRAAAVYGMSEIGAVLDGPPETVAGGEAGSPATWSSPPSGPRHRS